MKVSIPSYSLLEIARPILVDKQKPIEYFVASFAPPMRLSTLPQRALYFGIAICTIGSSKLSADLDTYKLETGSLITMAPHTIRCWSDQSANYSEQILFFTESMFATNDTLIDPFGALRFFNGNATKALKLNNAEQNLILELFDIIRRTTDSHSHRKNEIVRSYINITLNHIADIYDKYNPAAPTKENPQSKMVSEFKKLIIETHLELRKVNDYADMLNVTSKHLSETVKEVTGRTARRWIQDIVILEAKVMLKQTSLNITAISEALHFSDPSLFGKYFKRYANCTPAAYRKQL